MKDGSDRTQFGKVGAHKCRVPPGKIALWNQVYTSVPKVPSFGKIQGWGPYNPDVFFFNRLTGVNVLVVNPTFHYSS